MAGAVVSAAASLAALDLGLAADFGSTVGVSVLAFAFGSPSVAGVDLLAGLGAALDLAETFASLAPVFGFPLFGSALAAGVFGAGSAAPLAAFAGVFTGAFVAIWLFAP
ncbi:MAG TPA: hypothetical protein VFE52_02020 [Devosia sp.]|nr:hypothetical protein [Devosia sp.]